MKEQTYKEKVKDLEEKIEWNLDNITHLSSDSQTYKFGARIIRMYAMEYKTLTGEFYRRDWK